MKKSVISQCKSSGKKEPPAYVKLRQGRQDLHRKTQMKIRIVKEEELKVSDSQ